MLLMVNKVLLDVMSALIYSAKNVYLSLSLTNTQKLRFVPVNFVRRE